MIEVTEQPISLERGINKVKNNHSGCVVTYVGLIRDYSQGKAVLSIEYHDSEGNAENTLLSRTGWAS